MLSFLLTKMAFEVETIENGCEAKDLFTRREFDLVVTDLHMPGLDGWGLASHVKKASPGTPVIMITGAETDMVEGRMKNPHLVDSVFIKPFNIKPLTDEVSRLLEGREGPYEAGGSLTKGQKAS